MDLLVRSLALRGTGGFSNFTSANSTAASFPVSSTSIARATASLTSNAGSTALSSLNGLATTASRANATAPTASTTATTFFGAHANFSLPTVNSSATVTLAPNMTAAPFSNGTIDLNNATQCWPYYWSYSSMTWAWSQEHVSIFTKTYTYTSTVESALPSPSSNASFSILCDGLPRFNNEGEAANATVLLPTPTVTVITYRSVGYLWPTGTFSPAPSCSIKNAGECSAAWSLFGSSLSSSNGAWTSSNVLTVSLASPPTSMVVNSEPTPLAAAPGAFPTLTLHGEAYTADQGTYTISGGVNLYGEITLTPGGQQVLTWNMDQISRPFGPSGSNCTRPTGTIIQSSCATAQCTLAALSVDLLYFAPPSTRRDLCANTIPGFNSYSVSIYSHPHSSTVINSTTYWSDKAYVRYAAVSAYKWCDLDNMLQRTRVAVGGTYTNRLVEVSSSDISSICDWKFAETRPYTVIGATAKPFNFQDLVGDIPASAYQCMPRCQSRCDEIITGWYVPGLAVPKQVRAQDSAWASCAPEFDGVPDPPVALGSRPGFLSTTAMEPTTKQTALPGSTISPVPVSTGNPITTQPISTRFTQTIPVPTGQPPANNPDPPSNPNPNPNDPSKPTSPTLNNPNPPDNDPPNPNPNANPAPNNPPSNSNVPGNPNNPNPVTQAPSHPTAIATIGPSIINADPSHPGTIIVADPNTPGAAQTITAGGAPIVISGTTISVHPTSGAVIISGDTTLTPIGTVGGKPVFVDPSRPGIVIIGDPQSSQPTQTLSANGPSIIIDGTTLSLAPAATSFSPPSTTTVSGMTISRLADGTVVINNSQTLRPGDPQMIVDGHSVYIDPSGAILVDGQQVQLASPKTTSSSATVSGISLVLLPNGTLLVNNEISLEPGDPQISVDGHSIVIDPSGTVFVDGQQVSLSPASSNQQGDLIIVGPDGNTTTVHMPSATGTTNVDGIAYALAAAISDAFASSTSTSDESATKSKSTSDLFASVTGKVDAGKTSADPAPSSSPKSGGTRLLTPFKLMGVGIWIFMISTLWP